VICAQQRFDRLSGPQRAAVDPGQDLIQRLERPWHLEIGELTANPVPAAGRFHRAPAAIWL
jgi:hypothetical protein